MEFLFDGLNNFLGRTVTIFTTSGGLSGAGFTGVLISVSRTHVKLITGIGAAPACPIGSACTGPIGDYNSCGGYGGYGGYNNNYNWLGSITEIPLEAIASFTHNAI